MKDGNETLERSVAAVKVDTVEGSPRYALIEQALSFIEENAVDQPSLANVAAAVGLSPAHFQRVFSEWVGVSPKKYLGYLTLDHAKRLLAENATVLDATFESGLSSPGRLHDLFVSWEAMPPGVWASRGAGLTIQFGFAESPFGEAVATAVDGRLCGLGFTSAVGRAAALEDLRSRWPNATYEEDATQAQALIDAAFAPRPSAPLALIGAPFQIQVWEALLRVPTGAVTTYGDIATAIGRPKAVRAVGTAVGRNPISWLIPCHRALRKSGALGGYHWGLPIKRAMLAYEAARRDAGAA